MKTLSIAEIKEELFDSLNWLQILTADRYAGGHRQIFEALWRRDAKIIANYREDNYQGETAYAYRFIDGHDWVVIITDYFGSCSGCDAWEDASDNDCIRLVQTMVSNARVFLNEDDAKAFIMQDLAENAGENYSHQTAKNLLDESGNWVKGVA